MTWTYSFTGRDGATELTMKVFDHNDDPITTVTNDGSGITVPDRIVDIMREEAATARANGNTERWRDIHIRLATNDIEEREG